MAGNPWRCSQCGAVNEPEATSCRSCGKWASLFDLENGAAAEPQGAELAPAFEVEPVVVPELEVEPFEPEPFQPSSVPPAPAAPEPREHRQRRLLRSLLVPLALAIYLLVSLLSER